MADGHHNYTLKNIQEEYAGRKLHISDVIVFPLICGYYLLNKIDWITYKRNQRKRAEKNAVEDARVDRIIQLSREYEKIERELIAARVMQDWEQRNKNES
jgi:hypothetical protein